MPRGELPGRFRLLPEKPFEKEPYENLVRVVVGGGKMLYRFADRLTPIATAAKDRVQTHDGGDRVQGTWRRPRLLRRQRPTRGYISIAAGGFALV